MKRLEEKKRGRSKKREKGVPKKRHVVERKEWFHEGRGEREKNIEKK